MNGTIEILLGAILSIIITIWVEFLRKPKLRFLQTNEHDFDYSRFPEKRPADRARFLTISFENKPLSPIVRWLSRSAALQCHAIISFYHLDGQDVFGRTLVGRWSGTIEPIPTFQIRGDNIQIDQIIIAGNEMSQSTTRKDIYPGEKADLDIAARFNNEEDSFGWNDEAYFSKPVWRNQKWRLPKGRFIVKVELISAGDKTINYFRLINDIDVTGFRLIPALPDDVKRIKN